MTERASTGSFLLLWLKRLLVYFLGLFIMALGVVFSVKSALGVSPVTSLANVTHQISGIGLGACTTGTYCFYILVELLILRRDFRPAMLLQILASLFFGLLVSAATGLLDFIPAPGSYPLRLAFLAVSIPLIALGVMLYLAPAILPTFPGSWANPFPPASSSRTAAWWVSPPRPPSSFSTPWWACGRAR